MKQNLNILKQNIGVDVSQQDFKVTFGALLQDGSFTIFSSKTFLNNNKGIQDFMEWTKKWRNKQESRSYQLSITMEPTGIYHENLAYTLYDAGYSLHLILPNQSKNYAKSLGYHQKTDKVDAKVLARMGAERNLRLWQPISTHLKTLKNLTREYKQRVDDHTQAKNQLHAIENAYQTEPEIVKRTKALIDFIADQIYTIKEDITQLIKQDAKLANKMQKLTSITGIGLITTAIVVAETDGFAQFNSIKQLQSYAGYDLKIHQSGKWAGKTKISKAGNSNIRAALYMPAMTAINHCKVFKEFNQRLLNKGKKSMVANTAVQRKLLALMFTLWKNDTFFAPEYSKRKTQSTEKQPFPKQIKNNTSKQNVYKMDKHREMPEPESSFGHGEEKKAVGMKPTALDRHRFNASPYVFLRSKTNIEKL